MTKNDEIFKLFSEAFVTRDFRECSPALSFSCPNKTVCKVKKTEEPIWSPSVGSDNTRIMIVAEAPSNADGPGPRIGGLFEDREGTKQSPIHLLREFVRGKWNTTPYFTNLVKCGVASQSNKDILKKRVPFCFDRFLRREIEIIEPDIILCVGAVAYTKLGRYQSENLVGRSMELFQLIHYSRQAQLPLSPEDKVSLIWKWQVKDISLDEIAKMPLSQLSFFSRSPNSA